MKKQPKSTQPKFNPREKSLTGTYDEDVAKQKRGTRLLDLSAETPDLLVKEITMVDDYCIEVVTLTPEGEHSPIGTGGGIPPEFIPYSVAAHVTLLYRMAQEIVARMQVLNDTFGEPDEGDERQHKLTRLKQNELSAINREYNKILDQCTTALRKLGAENVADTIGDTED